MPSFRWVYSSTRWEGSLASWTMRDVWSSTPLRLSHQILIAIVGDGRRHGNQQRASRLELWVTNTLSFFVLAWLRNEAIVNFLCSIFCFECLGGVLFWVLSFAAPHLSAGAAISAPLMRCANADFVDALLAHRLPPLACCMWGGCRSHCQRFFSCGVLPRRL